MIAFANQSFAQTSEKHKYNGFNGAGLYVGIAGTSLMAAGVCRILAANDPAPTFNANTNIDDYNKSFKKWEKNQKTYNSIFGAGMAVAGLSMIFAGADLYYGSRNLKVSETAYLQFKASPTQAGLCLNFK